MFRRATACVLVTGAALGFDASSASAQSSAEAKTSLSVGDFQLSPTLEVRSRAEYRRAPVDLGGVTTAGEVTPVVDDAWAVFERARVGLGAERGAVRAQVTLQDARAWGDAPTGAGASSRAAVSAFEAFLEVHGKPVAGTDSPIAARAAEPRRSFVRVGRQRITWADGRLLSEADWSPAGRSLDAARARLSTELVDAELLAAVLNPSRPQGASVGDEGGPFTFGSQLFGALVGLTLDPMFKLELFGLARLQGAASNVPGSSDFAAARAAGETVTGALRVSGSGRPLDYSLAGYMQGGSAPQLAAARSTRFAYAFAAEVGRQFDGLVLSPSLHVGATLASGDDGSGNYAAFDPILPDVHVHYGLMNLFALSNVAIAHAALSAEPSTSLRVVAEYRYARLVNATGE